MAKAKPLRWKLYLSYGMMKCGSTLAFKLTRELLEHNGYRQELLPDEIIDGPRPANFVHDLTQEKVDAILEIVERTGVPLILKTHAPPTQAVVDLFESGAAIGHAVFRDPREMALSMLDHGTRTRSRGEAAPFADLFHLEDTFPRIRRQMGFFDQWCALPKVNPWFYDDFAWDKAGAIARARVQTGLKSKTTQILLGFNETKHMQFNRGVKARWKDDMSGQTSAAFEAEFKDFYDRFDELRSYWRKSRPGPITAAMMRAGLR